MVGVGESFTVQIRLAPEEKARPFANFEALFARRLHEADEFYEAVQAPRLSEDERRVQRQAYAGLCGRSSSITTTSIDGSPAIPRNLLHRLSDGMGEIVTGPFIFTTPTSS